MTPDIPLPPHVLAQMLLCVFRYCLGRRTYMSGVGAEWLAQYWHIMPRGFRQQIHEDILHAIEYDLAGDGCDVYEWQKVLKLPLGEET